MKLIEIYTDIIKKCVLESYDDLPLEYFKDKAKKLEDYSGYKDKLQKNGFVFLHYPKNDDWYLYGEIKVFNSADSTEIANATYGKRYEFQDLKGSMDVRSDFRRNKIATMMYDWIEKITNEQLTPDIPHSKSAELFWTKRLRK